MFDYLQLSMSKPQKGGIQFFKKMGEKKSMFDGMRFKGPKENKNTIAQSEVHLNFTEIKKEQEKSSAGTRDDLAFKQEGLETKQSMRQEPSFKKGTVKSSESSNKEETILTPTFKETAQQQIKEEKQQQVKSTEVLHQEKVSAKRSNSQQQLQETLHQSNKISHQSVPTSPKQSTFSPRQRKKSQKPVTKKPEPSIRKASLPDKKKQPQKAKKSDREQVLEEINQFTIKLANIILSQKQIKQTLTDNKKNIQNERQRIGEWSAEQSVCAEREEYEQADRLQTMIEEAEKKIEDAEIELSYLEEQLVVQQKQQISLLQKRHVHMKKLGRKLKLIELQLQDDAAIIKREELEHIEQLKNKQELQRKKIQRLDKDITYQSQQLTQFESIFSQEMENKLNPLQQQLESNQKQKTILENEIIELQRLLREKKSQLAGKNQLISKLNEHIQEANQSFREEQQRLQERKEKVAVIKKQKTDMEIGVDQIQKKIQQHTVDMDQKVQKKMLQAEELAQLAKQYEEKQSTFDDEIDSRKVSLDNFVANTKAFKQFEEKHRGEKEKVKELEYKKSTVTAQISKLEERRQTLKKNIPGIQIEQKKFAESKNFKAAGMKKAQIKDIQEELERIKELIGNYLGEEHQYQMNLEELKTNQKQILEEEATLQKNVAQSQYLFCKTKIKDVKTYIGEMAKASLISNKEKLLKELSQEMVRLSEEMKYLNVHFELEMKQQQPQQTTAEEEGEELEQELSNSSSQEVIDPYETVEDRDNNQQYEENEKGYEAPLIEEEEKGEEEQGGYVPLSLE